MFFFRFRTPSILAAQQKIRQMYDFYAIEISCGQFVQRDHIFGVVIFDFKEIGNLPIRLLRQPAAYLNIDTLIPLHRHKINLFRLVFSDIDLIAPPPQLKIHDVLQHSSKRLRIESHDEVF